MKLKKVGYCLYLTIWCELKHHKLYTNQTWIKNLLCICLLVLYSSDKVPKIQNSFEVVIFGRFSPKTDIKIHSNLIFFEQFIIISRVTNMHKNSSNLNMAWSLTHYTKLQKKRISILSSMIFLRACSWYLFF